MSTSPTRIAVLSRSFSRHPILRAELQARYPEASFNDTGRTLAGEELLGFLAGHDGAIVALEKMDAATLAAATDLKIIGKYGVGLDNVDLHACAAQGMLLGWSGGVNRRSVAELAISFMIAGLRGVTVSQAEIRAGIWRQFPGRQVSDVTVGLVGCGHVGQELARLLRCFGTRVIAHDLRDFPEFYAANDVTPVSLDALTEQADVISLHVPLTPKTRHLFDADRLSRMKRGAIIVNTARGGLVDEAALEEALVSGQLGAACFDVFEVEPPSRTSLLALPNFLATAHIGGSAEEAVLAMGRAAIDGLSNAVDPLSHIPEWARS
ncbi:phosphoglycerate dehydrogenase [Methylobacterium sp. sgz302541]|uniref:phosphoglycerate dehydrogenase n=1 Tax=unclassified Methylobacterium TaxID=2615210 RepID=UPI003D350B56